MSLLLVAALVGVSSACNPLAYVKSVVLRNSMSPFFVPGTAGNLTVTLKTSWYTGRPPGIMIHDIAGAAVARPRPCEPVGMFGQTKCPIPPLAVGNYPLLLSADASCGVNSYSPMAVKIEVIEPAHLIAITPAHGPAGSKAKVVLSGRNIGGPDVFCQYTFSAGPSAQLDSSGNPMGCSMSQASYPALSFSANSVACMVPRWPGPAIKCGREGCKPVEGAVCDYKVGVQVTNDARVSSPEKIFFTYDRKVGSADHHMWI